MDGAEPATSTTRRAAGLGKTNELHNWLNKIKRNADSLASNTVLMLDKLDASGDGKIQCAEMKKIIFDECILMQCLGALQLYGA